MGEILRTERLSRKYVMGEAVISAVDGVDISLQESHCTAIVGRSGSGKSTLLHLLGGLDRPTSGDVSVEGRRLSELDDDALAAYRRSRVGFIFQFFNLLPSRSALQNVELPLVLAGVRGGERRRRAEGVLERVGLGARLHHRPAELSGGEQQRVAVARALVHDPPLLMADEPTGNLDTRTSEEIISLLRELRDASGKTIVIVTHDRTLAQAYADRTLEMRDGKVVADSKRGD